VVEQREAAALFASPQHPYTAALLAAMPERSDGAGRLVSIPGVVPGLYDRPCGCLFAPRCSYATVRAGQERPALRAWEGGLVRCHHPLSEPQREQAIALDRPMAVEAAK
jgi:dipeptide transport system ATP-binding protein